MTTPICLNRAYVHTVLKPLCLPSTPVSIGCTPHFGFTTGVFHKVASTAK